ncbi:hypothetical protein DIPPA_65265 [Diplonema papillatum]|nr:hypothetical protein DIPPA_65265 [Diplonema papillatum]
MSFAVGDIVGVQVEVQQSDETWVEHTQDGTIMALDGLKATVDWGTGEEAYVTEVRHLRKARSRTICVGDRVLVQSEHQATDGLWKNTVGEGTVLSLSPGGETATIKLPDATEPYTTPLSFLSLCNESPKSTRDTAVRKEAEHLPDTSPDTLRSSEQRPGPQIVNFSGVWKSSDSTWELTCYHDPGELITTTSESGAKRRRDTRKLDGRKRKGEAGEGITSDTMPNGSVSIVTEGKGRHIVEIRKLLSPDRMEIATSVTEVKSGKLLENRKSTFYKVSDIEEVHHAEPDTGDLTYTSLTRFLLIEAITQSVSKADGMRWVRLSSVLSSIAAATYTSLLEPYQSSVSVTPSSLQQLPIILKLAAAAKFVPLSPALWKAGVLDRCIPGSRKRLKKIRPHLSELEHSEVVHNYYLSHRYFWDPEREAEPAPDFASKAIVLTQGKIQVALDALMHQPQLNLSGKADQMVEAYKYVLVATPTHKQEQEELETHLYINVPVDDIAAVLPCNRFHPALDMVLIGCSAGRTLLFLSLFVTLMRTDELPGYWNDVCTKLKVMFLVATVWNFIACIVQLLSIQCNLQRLHRQWLSDRHIGSGQIALQQLAQQAEDQEIMEMVLAYYILYSTGEGYSSLSTLQKKMTDFLWSFFLQSSELRYEEAYEKLTALGLVSAKSGSYRIGLTPKQYLTVRHRRWFTLLKNQMPAIVNKRI